MPAVIVLHGTGGSKEGSRSWLEQLAHRGFVAIAIDGRFHGERAGDAKGTRAYNEAIIQAWRTKSGQPQAHPFYYDTCWDIWRTIDYLQTRGDVDPDRIGMIGISKGGIETWLAAAVDERVKVAVPAISVQSFRWSLDHDRWQGRANTIKDAHEAVAADLGEPRVNARVCRALWSKVIPGILDEFDAPSMLRLFDGRSLLILNGEKDPNCPIEGAELAFAAARAAFHEARADDQLKIMVAQGAGHTVTKEQQEAALDWFVAWLKPASPPSGAWRFYLRQPRSIVDKPRLAGQFSCRAGLVLPGQDRSKTAGQVLPSGRTTIPSEARAVTPGSVGAPKPGSARWAGEDRVDFS
jgi:dienelactone hydrolase